jgi:hypothetical protein
VSGKTDLSLSSVNLLRAQNRSVSFDKDKLLAQYFGDEREALLTRAGVTRADDDSDDSLQSNRRFLDAMTLPLNSS